MALGVCVLITALFALVLGSIQPPSITGPALNTAVQTNGTANLQCTVSDGSSQITWLAGSPFTSMFLTPVDTVNDDHYSINGSDNSLTVTQFDYIHHGGDYTCKTESDTLSKVLLSCPGTLSNANIMADGGFNVEPTDTIASIGSMAVFKCSPPYSNPPANVHWLKDNDTVITITSSTKYIQADSGNLYIMDIVNADEGYYQCVASNTVTNEVSYSTKVYLSVIDDDNIFKEMFAVVPQNITVPIGGMAELECADTIGTAVQWEWVGHTSLPLSIVKENGALLIIVVTEEYNGGVFRCSITNTTNLITADAHLTVIAPPVAIISGTDLSGPPMTQITLSCSTESILSGPVTVAWQLSGFVLKTETITDIPSLVTVALPSEGGIWVQCIIQNQYGCSEESVGLTVITETPPVLPSVILSTTPSVLEMTEGDFNILSCTITHPNDITLFSFDWSIDGSPLFFPSTSIDPNTRSIIITMPGTYTCSAVTIGTAGIEKWTESITVTTPATTTEVTTPTEVITPTNMTTEVITPTNMTTDVVTSTDTQMPLPSTSSIISSSQSTSLSPIHTEHITSTTSTITNILMTTPTTAIPMATKSSSTVPSTTPVNTGVTIVSLSPSTINEEEGSVLTVTCITKNSLFVIWSHSDHSIDELDIQVDNLIIDDALYSIAILNPLLPIHQGILTCIAIDSDSNTDQKNVIIHVKAASPVNPPSNIFLVWLNHTSLQVTWSHPFISNNEYHVDLLGYKLSWGVADKPVPQVALRGATKDTNEYVINRLNRNNDYKVIVWPYSKGGDGPVITADTNEILTTEAPIKLTETIVDNSLPFVNMVLGPCTGLFPNIGSIGFKIIASQHIDYYIVNYTCVAAQSSNSLVFNEGRFPFDIILNDLLPGCPYDVVVSAIDNINGSTVAMETCSFTTFTIKVPFTFYTEWLEDTGHLIVTWQLSSGSNYYIDGIIAEIDINGVWIDVINDTKINTEVFDVYQNNTVDVRVRIGTLILYSSSITIPARPHPSLLYSSPTVTDDDDTSYLGTPWVTYGVGLAAVLFTIMIILSLILVLKHIQTKRRERNKVVCRERVVSLVSSQKSLFGKEESIQSIKKLPIVTVQTSNTSTSAVNNLYSYT